MSEKSLKLKVDGMTCDHCVETVLTALSSVPGVKFADVSVKEGSATVEYDDSQAKPEDFSSAVNEAGYSAQAV